MSTPTPSVHHRLPTFEALESRLLLAGVPAFDTGSADLSAVPFAHVQAGDVRTLSGFGTQAGAVQRAVFSQEQMLGVNVLRLDLSATGPDAFTFNLWCARDTSGTPYVFKVIDLGQTLFTAQSLDQVVPLGEYRLVTTTVMYAQLMAGTYAVGTTVYDGGGDYERVLSTTATLDQYPGYQFVQTEVVDVSGVRESYKYYHPSVFPAVYEITDSGAIGGWKLDNWPPTVADPRDVTITGTSGADTIALTSDGTNLTATVNGVSAAPVLLAEISSLSVLGLAGDDTITLGAGVPAATVSGGPGHDLIVGGTGNDQLIGNRGNDTINGGGGDDTLNGNAGHDALRGSAGNDRLVGAVGNDALNGGAGADTLIGGGGSDLLQGRGGDDWLYTRDGLPDTVGGGPGSDHAEADAELDLLGGMEDPLA